MAEKMTLEQVRDTLASWLGGSEACLDTRNVAVLESMVSACDALAAQGQSQVYRCPRCATAMQVDPTAKPAAQASQHGERNDRV